MTPFAPRSDADVLRLVREQPLAWLISRVEGRFDVSPAPLVVELDGAGAIVSFLGHLPLANPQVAALRRDPMAMLLFQGPHGYISPRLVSKRDWAPTWNFTLARFDVAIGFVPEETHHALRALALQLEAGSDDPWTPEKMGARHDDLARHVVAFRARVLASLPRFKHGQDEAPKTFDEIVGGLADPALAGWMVRTVRG